MLAILIGSVVTVAQAVDSPSFGTLLQQAQASAPRLLEQAANVRAAAADVRQAGAWLNPTLGFNAENIGARQEGVSQRENTFSITQALELGGKRAARVAAQQRQARAAGARERQTRVEYASELAIAYATAEAMQQRKEVADAEVSRAEDDLRAAQALVKAGREAELRSTQARASVSAARATAQAAAGDAIEALEQLTALVGATEPYTRIAHPFLSTAAAAPATVNWDPSSALALATASAERDALAAQVRVEQKRWLPDVGITLGMRRYGWTDDKAASVALTATIPLFDRNGGAIDAARERASSAAARVETARLDAVALHRSAVAHVQASALRLQAAEEGEIAATEAYRLGRIGYDSGKAGLVELLAIRRALADARERTIEARLARIRALATLSMAEGRIAFGEAP